MALRSGRSSGSAGRRAAPFVVLAALLAPLAVHAPASAADSATATVAPRVREQVADGGRTTFWVELAGRADLTGARALDSKPAKGAFVRSALSEYAEDSQAGLRDLLRSRKAEFEPFWITNTIKVVGDRELIAEIARRPEVRRIEADTRIALPEAASVRASTTARAQAPAPADGVEWNISRVGADRVWNELGVRGEGIVVANLDSGVQWDHPALINSYRGRLSNGQVDNNYNWFDPQGFCPTRSPCDVQGHGTHVMGIEVGSTADGKNQIGVAPGATWIAAGACANGGCEQDSLLASGQWIVAPTDQNGARPRPDLAPDVVNNSWMKPESASYFSGVLDAWVAAGILPVVAAGNSGNGGACGTNTWPASFASAYAVANMEEDGSIAGTSSRGPTADGTTKPDITAPGTSIRSASPTYDYIDDTGTSMAAPHVAGAVALLWSAAPALDGDIEATRRLLDDTANDIDATDCGGTADDNNAAGEGLLNVFQAVQAAPRSDLGALSGRIRDTRTGAPVADATVVLTGPRRIKTLRTGADGTYRLDRVLAGSYSFRISAFGHREASGSVTVASATTTTRNLALTALPTTTLTGAVRFADGPVAGATVAVADTPAHTVTGADGRYRLTVPTGTQELTAQSPSRCALLFRRSVPVRPGTVLDIDLPSRTDAFGHTCTDPVVGYRAGTTRLEITGTSGATSELPLPFPVRLYGQDHRTAWVSTNGVIGLGVAPEPPFTTGWFDLLPAPWHPAPALFPFYTTLDVDEEAGVHTTVTEDEVVVEWRNVKVVQPQTGVSGGRLSISAVLRPDGTITYGYRDVDPGVWAAGRSALIGAQNDSASDAFVFGNLEKVVTEGLGLTLRHPA